MLGSSTFMLSLISTVASLPFFLFTLPAGALADRHPCRPGGHWF
jgi:MFS family permease